MLLGATSTEWAPWYVIPADNKWVTHTLVAGIIIAAIRKLDLRYPEVSKEQRQALAIAQAVRKLVSLVISH